MSESNVAQDQIKAYVDRILRMKDEADAIASDIREIYAEAKGNGFDKTQLGNLVTYLRKKDKDAEKLAEGEAVFDLYLEAYLGASGKVGTKRATHALAPEKPDALAALRADPAMSIVDASTIKKPESQSAPQAGSDLTEAPAYDQGQVATHQPETANEIPGSLPVPAAEVQGGVNWTGTESETSGDSVERHAPMQGASEATEAHNLGQAGSTPAPATKYAEPGVIVWETTPPEGVERGAISMAFGTMGQDATVIADDLEKAAAQPIVKKGKVILDGWARYMAVRNMTELDGSPVAYPVVQYAGSDVLTDIIKLNVEGRILTDEQKRKIAANLARLEPGRKDDIYRAFELWMEPV